MYHFIGGSGSIIGGAVVMFVALVLLVDALVPVAAGHEAERLRSPVLAAVRLVRRHDQGLQK